MQRCIPRILPPWTWRAMGSLRAKHPWNWSWNAWSSSRNPSTSRGVRSNCGMENTSPSVRCAGNIFCLLVLICAFGGSVDRENQPVKYRCRCRVKRSGQHGRVVDNENLVVSDGVLVIDVRGHAGVELIDP